MFNKKEIESLIYLLDDEDDRVIDKVTSKLLSFGEPIILILENAWEFVDNPLVQRRIDSILQTINFNITCDRLKKWLEGDQLDLFDGSEIIAKYEFPELDSMSIRNSISSLAQKIWLELSNDLTPLEMVSVFNHIFFGENGYKVKRNSELYIRDFCINHVVEQKMGSPIMIGILFIIIARELNLSIYGVTLLNNFSLSYQKKNILNINEDSEKDALFYINPNNNGAIFGRLDIIQYLDQINAERKKEYFNVASNKMIIQELLSYMKANCSEKKNIYKLDQIETLLSLF